MAHHLNYRIRVFKNREIYKIAEEVCVVSKEMMAAVIGCSMMLALGCTKIEKEESNDTSDDYRQMVTKYNDLVGKYNSQTVRNTKGDAVIKLATLELKELDDAVLEYKVWLESSYRNLDGKKCSEARTGIEGVLRNRLEVISTKANALAQGTLVAALDRMSSDLSSYEDGTHEAVRSNISSVRLRLDSGLSGIKSFALFSHNRLIENFHQVCPGERIGIVLGSKAEVPQDSIVTVDSGGKREVISRDDLKSRYAGTYTESAYNYFSDIASGSGGFVGFSPTPELFSQTVDVVLESILEKSGAQTDVAIVLDTTGSMGDDISDVKKNMGRLLAKLKERSSSIGLRLSLVLYRDKGESYVVKVAQGFTDDIGAIDIAIQSVEVAGGGDEPEAVIDALGQTLKDLNWRTSASRSVVLIGDAPGHPSSHAGVSTEALMASYKKAGLGIIVYPILVSR